MSYKIGTIGQRFLLMMEVDYNQNYFNPSTMFENLSGNKKNLFQDSLFNPNFYLRAADEIMEKIFTPDEKNRLQELIVELKEKEASLIASASSKVSKIMNEHKSQSLPLHDYNNLNFSKRSSEAEKEKVEKWLSGIVVGVFEKIPPYALNLLGLIEINPERFPESYNLFKQMLKDTEQGTRFYDKNEIKGFFSKALEELEKFAKDVKDKKKSNETKKEETANLGEEKVKNETPTEQTPPPNQNQSEGDKHNPTDSKEKPEGKNNSENNENTNESNNTDSPNLAKLQTLKTQAIAEITAALDQIPPLTSSDLASEYQNWENKINNLADENQINFLKTSVLFDIQDQRKAKIKKQTTSEVSEIINSNLQKAQNPAATIQEKKETLIETEQYEGQSAYEEANTKEQIKNLKKEVARDNLVEYRDKIISDLTTKLKNNRLKESELDPETKSEIETLKKETDPDKLVEKEVKITQKIGQQGVTKKITTLERKIEDALESNDKTEINKLKKQLIEFMNSNNVYYQAKKGEVKQLLKQLESNFNHSESSETLPFYAQIGLGMGAVLAVLFFALLIWKKKRQAFFQSI